MRNQILNVKSLMFLFAIVLLTCGVQGISYGQDAVEGEITTCDVNHVALNHFNVTVAGTVTARRSVTSLKITAYANGDWIGFRYIGELPAGRSANFSITGLYVSRGNENQLLCTAEWDWLEWVTTGSEDDDEQTTPDGPQSDLSDTEMMSGAAAPTVEPGDDDTTLVISFTDTFDWIQDHAAYQFEVRRKSPLGTWRRDCTEAPVDVPFPDEDVSRIVTIEIIGLDPGTTYQVRYRKGGVFQRCSHTVGWRNWSAIVEGTTSGVPGERVQPDLVVEQPTVSKSTLPPGENFTLSATVKNQGTGSAAATTLRYYRSTDATISTSDTEIGTDSVSALGANGNRNESITVTAPAEAGTYYYGACVDSVTDESNANNNCSASVSITVERVNLVLSASTTAPLTESNLDGSVVTLTLSGGTFELPFRGISGGQIVSNSVLGVEVSGIPGVTIPSESVPSNVIINGVRQDGIRYAIDRISDTELAVELGFDGTNFDTDAVLTFTVEAAAIENYDGSELTAQISVTAITAIEFSLSVPAGISLIHVPLRVTEVDGVTQTIESVSDLYDALGGTSTVNFLITYDSQAQEWHSYFGPSDTGTPADRELTDDMGIIAGMTRGKDIRLSGEALGTNGSSTITLTPGLNLVGLPLNDSSITRVSDLFTLDGIGGNVPVIILTDGGEFKAVGRAGDPGDIEITGGQAFIMTASRAATVAISGDAWANGSGAAAPPVTLKGIEVGNSTPVLGLRGAIVDEGTGLNNAGFRVTVKNLSTGRAVATVTTPDEAGYRSTVVAIETGRAARVGDMLEISAESPNPFVGVEPVRYIVTAADVNQSLIQLPELIAYEIPAETQLLSNYPNPFNPETWIPYRLADDTNVSLSIYDINGALVRELDLGHQRAGYYTDRTRAAYWNGRNEWGERVVSGVYFYQLRAGDYSQMRKMVILK